MLVKVDVSQSSDCAFPRLSDRQTVAGANDDPRARAPVAGRTVGERINARLEQLGMSQRELARRMGIDRPQTINDWISGRQDPRAHHLRLLRSVLEMTLDELLGVADGQEPPFQAWRPFVAELAAEGDTLTRDEERGLKSILWPDGKEPTVFGYRQALALMRTGVRTRQ